MLRLSMASIYYFKNFLGGMNNAKPIDLTGPRYKAFFVLEAQLNLLKG